MKKMVARTYTDLGNGMGHGYAEEIEVVELTDECIERIADAVAKKLAGDEEKMTFMDIIREMAGEEPRSCDRNICTRNEYNGISCDDCEVAKYHNLEDDDSICRDCGVGE